MTDTVDHGTLLTILKSRFSITSQSLAWFHSYLTDRTQFFYTHSIQTLPLPFTHGVLQGSRLGPLKFVAYTSYIPNIFSSHNVQYHFCADNTQVYNHCILLKSPYRFLGCSLVSVISQIPSLHFGFNKTHQRQTSFSSAPAVILSRCWSNTTHCSSVVRSSSALMWSTTSEYSLTVNCP